MVRQVHPDEAKSPPSLRVLAYFPFVLAPMMPWMPLAAAMILVGWAITMRVRRDDAVIVASLASMVSLPALWVFRFTIIS